MLLPSFPPQLKRIDACIYFPRKQMKNKKGVFSVLDQYPDPREKGG